MALRQLTCILLLSLPVLAGAQSMTAEEMREDLTSLIDVWSHTDRSLTPEHRMSFEAAVADISRRANGLSPSQFALEVSRAVAIARNGHSQAQIERRLHFLPIGFAWFADGLFVVRSDNAHADLLGSKVSRFGALSVEQASSRAGRLISGNDAWVRQQSAVWLSSLEVLAFIGASKHAASASLTLESAVGQRRRVSLEAALAPDPSPAPAWMGVVPAPTGTPGRWSHVLDGVQDRPAVYRDVTNLAREWWRNDQVFYLRSNYIYGNATNRYELFDKLIGVLQVEVAERHPRIAIIDLRLNHGGDFFNTVSFANALPKLMPPDGRIFVLVGPDTFSAAIATAAMIKSAGGNRVAFVGETLGDDAEFWSEGPPVTLPHSGIVITSGTRKHNWASSCAGSADCYWGNVAFGPEKISLAPDIRIAVKFSEYAAGRDPVLQAALDAGTGGSGGARTHD
jgi:hypothetical protein